MKPRTNWTMIAAFAFAVAATQALWVTYTPITTAAAESWGVSVGAVGWLAEVYPLLYVLLALPFGYWADRSFRGSLALGAILTVAGACLRVPEGYAWALAGQIVVSVAQPLVLNGINKIAALYAAPSDRPAAIAIGSSSMFVGILLSTVTVPAFMEARGLVLVNGTQAVFAAIAALALLLALKAKPMYAAVGETASFSVREIWRERWVRQLSLLLFVGFGLFIALTTWLEVLSEAIGMDDDQVGIGLGAMTVAGIVGAGIVPKWASVGSRGRAMLCVSLVVSAATLAALWAGGPGWLVMTLLGVTGFLLLADLPIILVTAETKAGAEKAGTVTGMLLLFGNLGGIALALAVQGLLFDRGAAIGLLIVVAAAMLPLALRYPAADKK